VSSSNYHLDHIPEGFQIFDERLEVAGIAHRRTDAAAFFRGTHPWLEFERDTANPYDKNAIRVIGCSKGLFGSTRRYFIGYVPAPVAEAIVEGGYFARVRPRLLNTWMGDTGNVEVLFQVLGPKGERYDYERADPASLPPEELGKQLHYTDFVSQVKYLKQKKRYNEATDLLLKLVDETEREAKREGHGVAPWYYEQLAVIYRMEKRISDEVSILERYERQSKAPGALPEKLAERLQKARTLLNGNAQHRISANVVTKHEREVKAAKKRETPSRKAQWL
jgi:hypothetical protein